LQFLPNALDLALLHSQHGAVQEDVLTARELGMETGPDPGQAPAPATDLRPSARGRRDAREDLEQRRLAGAVAADDAEHLALGHHERDVAECPDLLVVRPVVTLESCDRFSSMKRS